jgi:hypothetical protein
MPLPGAAGSRSSHPTRGLLATTGSQVLFLRHLQNEAGEISGSNCIRVTATPQRDPSLYRCTTFDACTLRRGGALHYFRVVYGRC